MSSFSIPLTGLESSTTALNTIANNLANMNTTAFKSQDVSFSDLFYQQIGESGSGDPLEVGAGSQVASTSTDFTEGSVTSTGNEDDMAIGGSTGAGFFVVQNGNTTEYTRDGSFTLSSSGNLTTQGGLNVMGYPVNGGVVDTNAPLTPIQLPVGSAQQPAATQNLSVTANLDSAAAVGTQVSGQVELYDSLGQSYDANVTFTNTGTNTWSYSVSLPAGAASGEANTTGALTFDSNGNLTSPATNLSGISFTGLADGASNLTFNWNLYGSNNQPTITQFATTSNVASYDQDGYASGQYDGFTVDSSGLISAQFSNGETAPVGQIALANVVNPEGLSVQGGNLYQTTLTSGAASIGVAGTGGLGTIQDAALEASNVNISNEFSNLIIAQQAYEASSKAITTFDTVSQDTINMIH
ncbi:MAG TPA: flagellar hook protein FlgE [Acidobacteriaceae bacterium]|nr:flagellar hook protein FlgE [Acidobacteriaceae bacterium]